VLAPGTTLSAEADRAAYVRDHLVLWGGGWLLWIVAAVSLILFYGWWTARVRAGAVAFAIALLGFAADLFAETMLIVLVPERPELARTSFLLTGGVANSCYTLAGALLSLRTPGLRGPFAAWTAAVWLSGGALSAFAFLELPLGIAVSTAVLFALFLPWLLVMGRRLA
jgi:hypothetical protein